MAVSTHLDLAKAAHSLGLSLRSLNRNLNEIETALGVRLWIPHGREQLLLSTEGLALLQLLQPVVKELQEFADISLAKTLATSEFNLAWCGAWPITLLPVLIDKLEAEWQGIYPIIRRLNWAYEVEQQVLDGNADLGLSCRPPIQSELAYWAGPDIPFAIVGKQKSPNAPLNWKELKFVTGLQTEFGSIHGYWDDKRFPRQIIMRTEALSPVLDLLSTGDAVAWLPLCLVAEFIQAHQLAIVAPPPQDRFLTPHLIWRRDSENSEIQVQTREILQKSIQRDLQR